MSNKILRPGEVGYVLLIEYDAGFIDKSMNEKIFVNESFEVKENEPVHINCILQKWGVKNKNGRVYPKDVLVPQVEEFKSLVDSNSAVSQADHPDSSIVSLSDISHLITKIWWGKGDKENILYGTIKLIISPGFLKFGIVSVIGDKILLYLQSGIKIGISSRGVGSLKDVNGENIVQDDFELICFDLVATPSTPGAYLFPGLSSDEINMKETYKNDNGTLIGEDNKIITTLNKFLL
jgi:hypothetical protein